MQLHSQTELPEPSPEERRHSEVVRAAIVAAMRAGDGSLSFGEFMQQALYAPGLGYYAAGAQKFGAAGDFVTAPEVSPLFGRVLARQLAPVIRATGGDVLELGAGSGALAVELLRALEKLDALPGRYRVLDVSAELQDRQRQRVAADIPHLATRVDWLDRLPTGLRGVVIANEVADALPVERFRRTDGGVEQLRVTTDGSGFRWASAAAPDWLADGVLAIERTLGGELPAGYLSELSPGLHGWIADLAAGIDTALVMLVDYGVARHEYYAPDRSGGWLRCHFRHRAHDDPLILPGLQDLTAWVDFTAVAEAAVDAGLDVAGYAAQAQFLLHGGLADELAAIEAANDRDRLELSRQVKLLTLPGEMGEHFKCMALSRGDVPVPEALRAADRSHIL